ncbi:MAG: hypothetical protein K0S30_382, partial [Clostridia bacterium]|nr:hypothetical protein [Clostridia bacterium]
EQLILKPDYQTVLGTNAVHSVKPLSAEVFGLNAYTYYCDVIKDYIERKNAQNQRKTKKFSFGKKNLEK